MSQSFTGVNTGNLGSAAFERSRMAMDAYSKKLAKVEKGKTIETSLGSLKLMHSGKQISEAIGKHVKPIIKQQINGMKKQIIH